MKKSITAFTGLVLAGAMAVGATYADEADPAVMAAVKARQSQMTLYAFNIGVLGGMAKGAVPYDAAMAKAAASNLAALAKTDQSRFWPMGSDNFELGDEVTAALPAIWTSGSDVMTKAGALVEASAAMDMAAGDGLEALRGAMGGLGGACGACHKAYRQPHDH